MTRDMDSPSTDPIERLFVLAHDLLGTASPDGYLTCLNPAWEKTFGWTKEQLKAEPLRKLIHPDDLEEATKRVRLLLGDPAPAVVAIEDRCRASDGSYRRIEWTITVDEGEYHLIGRDVTERRAAEDDKARATSLTDAIVESADEGIVVADSEGLVTYVNSAGIRLLGHGSAAVLLGSDFHATAHHSRVDGSPLLVEDCPITKVRRLGRSIHVQEDIFWREDGSPLPVSFSSAPIDLVDGTGSVVAFHDISPLLAERERVRADFGEVAWFEEIRLALAHRRFVLYAQPIVSTTTGETVRHELLLRMLSPTGRVIEAGEFLPAAERFGLVNQIDRWVITRAVEIAASGRDVAVNLSASSVGNDEILVHIEREIARTGAKAEKLVFEVTETAVMNDLQDGRRFAERLVALGCAFALDDFGTGYGSFTYLRHLPITHLKIDVQFVQEMVQDEADQRLVQTIVSIAKSLGKKTIAEGVEDQKTLDMLRDFGVDFAQGYFLGRPEAFPKPPSG
ncbi:MAG TPA: EAL domain-containing protein [Acidimicrobiales bacterium]|nr:EAL domain-containing protein [Acidimicrobiales bacterium]